MALGKEEKDDALLEEETHAKQKSEKLPRKVQEKSTLPNFLPEAGRCGQLLLYALIGQMCFTGIFD